MEQRSNFESAVFARQEGRRHRDLRLHQGRPGTSRGDVRIYSRKGGGYGGFAKALCLKNLDENKKLLYYPAAKRTTIRKWQVFCGISSNVMAGESAGVHRLRRFWLSLASSSTCKIYEILYQRDGNLRRLFLWYSSRASGHRDQSSGQAGNLGFPEKRPSWYST